MARSEFQDNAISLTQSYNLSGLGNDVLAAVSSTDMQSGANIKKAIESAQKQTLSEAENSENLGLASGSTVGVTGKLDHFNKTMRERLVREAKAKNTSYDILLLEHLDNRITELEGFEDALQECIDALNRGEELPCNPDGSLQNEEAEKAIREYEEKYGVKIDRADPDALREVLGHVRDTMTIAKQARNEVSSKIESARNTADVDVVEHAQLINNDEDRAKNDAEISYADDETKIDAILARDNLDDKEAEFYLSEALDVNKGDSLVSLGNGNPFASGDISASFSTAAATPTDESLSSKPDLALNKVTLDPM